MDISFMTVLAAISGSSLVGVIVGGFITNHTASKQLKAEDRRLCYRDKKEAYNAFLSEYHRFILTAEKGKIENPTGITEEEISESMVFSAAYSSAAMIAPASVRNKLQELYKLTTLHAKGDAVPNLTKAYCEAQKLLHDDLMATLNV